MAELASAATFSCERYASEKGAAKRGGSTENALVVREAKRFTLGGRN